VLRFESKQHRTHLASPTMQKKKKAAEFSFSDESWCFAEHFGSYFISLPCGTSCGETGISIEEKRRVTTPTAGSFSLSFRTPIRPRLEASPIHDRETIDCDDRK
jgi:hypothetical protein